MVTQVASKIPTPVLEDMAVKVSQAVSTGVLALGVWYIGGYCTLLLMSYFLATPIALVWWALPVIMSIVEITLLSKAGDVSGPTRTGGRLVLLVDYVSTLVGAYLLLLYKWLPDLAALLHIVAIPHMLIVALGLAIILATIVTILPEKVILTSSVTLKIVYTNAQELLKGNV